MKKIPVFIQVMVKAAGSDNYKTIRFKEPIETTGSKTNAIATIKNNASWAINAAASEFKFRLADYSVCLVRETGSVLELTDGHTACITQPKLHIGRTPVFTMFYDHKTECKRHPYWRM